MQKILLFLLLFITLIFPNSHVFAVDCSPGTKLQCPGGKEPEIGDVCTISPGHQEPATCLTVTPTVANPATPVVANPPPEPCDPAKKNCTTAGGLPCTPGAATDTNTGPGIKTAIGCIPTEPKALVEGILKLATFASGGIAFLLMILGALQMITAEGNPESIKHGQERFYSAIIGLLLIIFAVLLMQVIGVDILGLPNIGPAK